MSNDKKKDDVDWKALKCTLVSKSIEKAAKFVCCICGHRPEIPEEYTQLVFKYNDDNQCYTRAVCGGCKNVLKD